ncbi:YDG domain-containing protein [Chromobacterium vaccinii]|uniref:YDG domain-containing protein n=1 Tax=Chromobacterium vaccinii TaxID=1108595 RepID=UPI003C716B17
MNRIYNVIWHHLTQQWTVVSEHTCAKKRRSSSGKKITPIVLSLLGCLANEATAAPAGGQVTSGSGNIRQAGTTTTVVQNSQNLALNWNSFNVSSNETVNFIQPNRTALAVNYIRDNSPSQIMGHLNANGQLWLINPNGMIFGRNAQVNVGSLIASTLSADNNANNGTIKFTGSGTGSIVNQGQINAAQGGYVAFLGNAVSNQGTINASAGAVALAGGSEISVDFADHQLVSVQVNESTLNNLAENRQLIQADGGQVIMTAGAHDSILSSAVNNSGIIEARTLENHNGTITLLAGMTAGTTSVAGTLDASAPNGGDGGHIDTSAAHVDIAPGANITTKAPNGSTGSWTIDPQNYTIAASGGDITGSQVSSLLASNNIIISSTQGATAGSGDLNVNDAISWSNANSLTLNAVRNVSFNSGGTVTNTGGGTLSARADANASGTGTVVMNGGSINVSGTGGAVNFYYNPAVFGTASSFSNVTVGSGDKFTAYMLINSASKLQSMSVNTAGNYALGTNIDASSISNFTPVAFTGNFDGLNYAISNLTVNASANNAGLFSTASSAATIQNVTLGNASITGHATVGALVGNNAGTIKNITVSGTVSGSSDEIGGVVGYNTGTLDRINSSATVNGTGVSGASDYVGGLIGYSTGGAISNASVTGAVNTAAHNYYVGGFIGYSNSTISNSSATGNVNSIFGGYTGGFIGYAGGGTVSTSYATGSVSAGDYGYDDNAGFIGVNYAPITNCYSTGTVNLAQSWYSGSFVGQNRANISNSYSTGNITVSSGPAAGGDGSATYTDSVGGFVGYNVSGNLSNVYATGSVTSTGQGANGTYYGSYYVGGLVGYVGSGNITHSYATGNVTATALIRGAGGLVGEGVAGTYTNDYASGNVTATQAGYSSPPSYVGGLLGYPGATLVNTYSVGNVSVSAGTTNSGGLTGAATTITGSSFWDTTTSGKATDPSTHAVGMNTANMQTQANFTSATAANGNSNPAWDFSTVWKMGSGSYLYPVFQTPDGPTSTPGATTPVVAAVYYPLTLSNFSASNKVYDGTTAASSITASLAGILPGQSVSLSPLSGTFVNKNVGNGKTITLSSTPTLAGANAGNYQLAPYVVNAFSANITPLAITVAASGQNKTYDGTVADTVTLSSSGVLAGDTVNFSDTSASFANKNVGTGKAVSVSGISASGADAGNYTLNNSTATTSANITPLAITVAAAGQNRTYDGTVNDAVTLSSSGVLAGDTVNFADTSASFANKNVGNGKTVSVSGISASGADAGNYTVSNSTATTSANITPLAITVAAAGQSKTYDGTVSDTVTLSSSGVLAGDTVNFADTSASFANKNVGNAKAVTVSGISASGGDAGNYTLSNSTATTSASITPLAITVGAAGQNKTYDGTVNDTVTLSSSGVLAGDTVNFSSASASFADKNVGNGKTVSVSGISASGADGGNYTINNSTATTSANITPLAITVAATGQNKVYDGTVSDTVTLASGGVLAGDAVSFSDTGASFANKNVGTGKTVTVSGISASGADAGNYTLNNGTATTSANITPLAITVGATGQNKVYDATTGDTVTLASAGVLAGDTVNFTSASASFANKNVGTGKTVSVAGISASGADAGNYTLNNSAATTSANITPLALSVNGAGASDKLYDGGNAASLFGSIATIAGDAVTLSGNGTFASAHVARDGSGNVIAQNVAANYAISGADAGNYTLSQPTGLSASIRPVSVTASVSAASKTYDGSTSATLSSQGVTGTINGETLVLNAAAANFDTQDAGTGKTVTASGLTLGNGTGLASDYALQSTTAATTANINQAHLSVSGLIAAGKTYDGTTNVTITNWGNLNGLVAGETLTLDHGTASFSSAGSSAGTVTVTASGYSLANGSGKASNYVLDTPTATTQAAINKALLTVTANNDAKIVTQADNAGSYNGVSYSGFVNGETASVLGGALSISRSGMGAGNGASDPAGSYANSLVASGLSSSNYAIAYQTGNYTIVPANVLLVKAANTSQTYGSAFSLATPTAQYLDGSSHLIKTLTVTANGGNNFSASDGAGGSVTFTLSPSAGVYSGSNNLALGNYNLSSGNAAITGGNFSSLVYTGVETVTPKALTPSASGVSKTYDATTAMSGLSLAGGAGVIAGDAVNVSGVGAFASANAGNQAYTVSNLALSGNDAADYYVTGGTLSGTGTINARHITLNAQSDAKTYDGTTGSTQSVAIGGSGLVGSDNISGLAEQFASKNVLGANGSTLSVKTGYVINDGNGGGNYIVDATNTASGTINQAALTLSAQSDTKTYNGTTASAGTVQVSSGGLVGGDSFSALSQSFDSKNAGSRTLSVNYAINDGNGGGNYQVTTLTAGGTIAQKALTDSGMSINSKVYDGTTAATINSSGVLNGVIAGDSVSVDTSHSSAVFSTKNVGSNLAVAVSSVGLGGTDAGNYTLTQPSDLTGNITAKGLTVTGSSAAGKTYDGTTATTVSGGALVGLVSGDSVTLSQAGSFVDPNAGTNKAVTANDGLSGLDAANYTLTQPLGITANITPKTISASFTIQNKVYDGSTTATVSAYGFSGLVGSDSLTLSGASAAFSDKNVAWSAGPGSTVVSKTVSISGYTLGNGSGLASNYQLASPSATSSASITPLAITVAATGQNKVYDGTTADTVALASGGVLAGDTVNFANTGASFANKNVGTGKTVSVTGISASGADAGNYTVNSTATTSANITPLAITVSATGQNKVYDATTGDIVTLASSGVLAGDSVSFSDTSASFADKNVGTGKTVSVAGITANGADAGNYTLNNSTATTSANITQLALSVSGAGAYNKLYDGGNAATLYGSIAILGNDAVTLSNNGTFASAHVARDGSGNVITQNVTANYAISGADAGNYTLSQPTGLSASILPVSVTASVGAANKTYDGSTSATLSSQGVTGAINGETLVLNAAAANFNTQDAGTGKTVTASGLTLGNGTGLASDYALQSTTATATANINQAHLSVSGLTAADKTYDGSTSVDITNWGSLNGLVAGESLTLNHGNASFSSAGSSAGTITVTASGYSLANGSGKASNYVLDTPTATTQATINQALLTVTANNDAKIVTQTDNVGSYNGVSYSGFVNGETASALSGTLSISRSGMGAGNGASDPAGSYANSLVASGLSSSNYAISYQTGNYTIVPANVLLVKAANASQAYGSAFSLAAPTAQYLDGTSNLIKTLTVTANGGNSFTANDGAGGTATFTLSPSAGVYSGSNNLALGNYNLTSGNAVISGGNFSSLVYTGVETVTPKALTPSASSGASKTYDGTTAMNGLSLAGGAGVIAGDAVNVSGNGAFASANAGSEAYTINDVILSGSDAADYYVTGAGTVTGTGTINARHITLNAQSDAKTYDGTTGSTQSVAIGGSGLVGSDNISGLAEQFASKNVLGANGSTLSVKTGYVINDGNSGGNYIVDATNTASGTINQAALTLSAQSDTKTYNGTTASAGTVQVSSGGLVGGDSFSALSQSFDSKNAGSRTLSVNYVINDGNGGGNYQVTTLTAGGTIAQKALTASGLGINNKVYDGTTAATINASTGVLNGLIAGDSVGVDTSHSSATFSTKNVGTNLAVTVNSVGLSGADAGNYTLSSGTGTASASITPLAITVAASGQNKTYDGGTGDTVTLASSGVLAGDTVHFSDTGASFADKNVGNAKTVTVAGISASGTDAGNYTVNSTATTSANITPLAITVSAVGQNKTYDGTTGDAVTLSSGDVLAGDVVHFADAGASFANKNVGNAKTVSVTGITANGGDAGNYTINRTATTSASITPLAITVAAAGQNKVYDGTVGDTVTLSSGGVLAGDSVSFSDAGASFANKNVGNGKIVSVAGISASGADAGNYIVSNGTAVTSASITPRAITVVAAGQNKVYDGTTGDTVTLSSGGVLAGDTVNFSDAGASFTDKNVGNGKTVTVAGIFASGADAGNYAINGSTTTTASITPITLYYFALPQGIKQGETPYNLIGEIRGNFVNGENLGNATYGTLTWLSNGNANSAIGQYAIFGGGLSAQNYIFVQDPSNATALTIYPNQVPFITQTQNDTVAQALALTFNAQSSATPYGLATSPFSTGNVAANRKYNGDNNTGLTDFTSDLNLNVIDGGVKLSIDRMTIDGDN